MAVNGYLTSGNNLSNLESELASFRASDQRREEFVEHLIKYLKDLESRQRELHNDFESEKEARRTWQDKARAWEAENDRLSRAMSTGCFTLTLIDGDGAVFQDALLAAGTDGGSNAAHKLITEVKNHLSEIDTDASHLPLVVQVYANLDGLSKKLFNCGIIKTGQDLYSFVRSFNMSQPLFSITDVGSGKERADHKLKETLRLYVNNQQCKHIVLGGIAHDNGYIPNLNPLKYDLAAASRISLLETVSIEAGYVDLGFPSFKCPSVFRSEHLPSKLPLQTSSYVSLPSRSSALSPGSQQQTSLSPAQHPTSVLQATQMHAHASQSVPRSLSPPSDGTSPIAAARMPIVRADSTSNTLAAASDGEPSSWATVGKSGTAQKSISIAPTPKKERQFIVLNKDEERLDPPINKNKADFHTLQERIKKSGKVCNYYHILGRCEDYYCEYKHEPRISESERVALRIKARQTSCHNMGACRDMACINGHICPYGVNCNYDSSCFFADAHKIDRNPASRCFDDGSVEPFRPALA